MTGWTRICNSEQIEFTLILSRMLSIFDIHHHDGVCKRCAWKCGLNILFESVHSFWGGGGGFWWSSSLRVERGDQDLLCPLTGGMDSTDLASGDSWTLHAKVHGANVCNDRSGLDIATHYWVGMATLLGRRTESFGMTKIASRPMSPSVDTTKGMNWWHWSMCMPAGTYTSSLFHAILKPCQGP
jgi:hypothetical protein